MSEVCLIIGPIGKAGTKIRRDSDRLIQEIVLPALKEVDPTIEVFRADQLASLGDVNKQVVRLLLSARLVVCDMTDKNSNAFYELAIRHAAGLPCVHVLPEGDDLPFDVSTLRAAPYTFDKISESQARLRQSLSSALSSEYIPENPILDVLSENSRASREINSSGYQNWNMGRTNLVAYMRRVYLSAESQKHQTRRDPLLGDVEVFLQKAVLAGTVLLAQIVISYKQDQITNEDFSRAATRTAVLISPTGGKANHYGEPNSGRVWFDVIASQIEDVQSFCDDIALHHGVTPSNFGTKELTDMDKRYAQRSIFRPDITSIS